MEKVFQFLEWLFEGEGWDIFWFWYSIGLLGVLCVGLLSCVIFALVLWVIKKVRNRPDKKEKNPERVKYKQKENCFMNELRCEQEKKALEFLSVMGAAKFFADVVKIGEGKLAKFFADLHECPALENYIKRFEEEKEALVYYATKENCPWGECVSLLYVSQYQEDWLYQMPRVSSVDPARYIVTAYVWNMSDESRSEFGSIMVERTYGMLVRVG